MFSFQKCFVFEPRWSIISLESAVIVSYAWLLVYGPVECMSFGFRLMPSGLDHTVKAEW